MRIMTINDARSAFDVRRTNGAQRMTISGAQRMTISDAQRMTINSSEAIGIQ